MKGEERAVKPVDDEAPLPAVPLAIARLINEATAVGKEDRQSEEEADVSARVVAAPAGIFLKVIGAEFLHHHLEHVLASVFGRTARGFVEAIVMLLIYTSPVWLWRW